jgi:hypothetical protein
MYHRLSYISGGIFVRSDIMYHRLSFVSGGALLFKSSTLYIRSRGTMKSIKQPSHQFYSPTCSNRNIENREQLPGLKQEQFGFGMEQFSKE